MSWKCVLGIALAMSLGPAAQASLVTFVTPTGATAGGLPVNATVSLTTGTDSITVTIQNLLADPTSIIQTINGVSFSLSTGQTQGSLQSGTYDFRRVTGTGPGGYSDSTVTSSPWNYNQAGLGIEITSIGNARGAPTIIGDPDSSNAYTHANSSITGNNVFLAGPSTFTLNVPGVTANTTVTGLQFEFGTMSGTNVIGVSEPSSLTLASIAAVLGLGWRMCHRNGGKVPGSLTPRSGQTWASRDAAGAASPVFR